jgi:alpha,alpha-trehalase
VVHSWVLARADRPGAWHLFSQALNSDVADVQGGTTPEGIHSGAMAGTVDLVQRCFTGIETRGDVLWLNPALPNELKSLTLNLRYRGQVVELHLTSVRARLTTQPSNDAPVTVGIRSREHRLQPGTVREFRL